MKDEISDTTVQDRLANVAASVGGAATRIQEASQVIQGKLDTVGKQLESLAGQMSDLTASINKHAESNNRASRGMFLLTCVYVVATLVMAYAAWTGIIVKDGSQQQVGRDLPSAPLQAKHAP